MCPFCCCVRDVCVGCVAAVFRRCLCRCRVSCCRPLCVLCVSLCRRCLWSVCRRCVSSLFVSVCVSVCVRRCFVAFVCRCGCASLCASRVCVAVCVHFLVALCRSFVHVCLLCVVAVCLACGRSCVCRWCPSLCVRCVSSPALWSLSVSDFLCLLLCRCVVACVSSLCLVPWVVAVLVAVGRRLSRLYCVRDVLVASCVSLCVRCVCRCVRRLCIWYV
ncbi:hypothetical protein GDO81_018870 [Engystomops pustulosus]|uniref:Uncharacterized protein n=1 Tax=Engystomops pustulosus TaxID=76066 RepID=A0AAV6ZR10_ENGPU|nr:hypothetical protein GDO81_018870 [Engystomops pustulosus]